jgi:outer membrane protein assembly factor BamB
MKSSRIFLVGVAGAALLASSALAENWPAWRGPTGQGVSTESGLPLEWSQTKNVRWKTPLPGPGNSTPIVWGDKVFINQASGPKGQRRELMCFDRRTGKTLWKKGVTYREEETTHKTNPQCSGSPATDGERVVVSFSSGGVFCYDMNGKELWKKNLGKQDHIWGNGASPVIHGDLCLLNFGPGPRTFLIAMDKRTGKELWRNDEPGGRTGKNLKPGDNKREAWKGSWSDPVPFQSGGRTLMLMMYPGRLFAFDPLTGKEAWTCGGLNPLAYTSPIYADGIAIGMGGYGGNTIAVRVGGKGDVTETHRLWRNERTKQRIGSGVIHDGHIYILDDPGIAECVNLKTGVAVWQERLRGKAPTSQNWSSMVLADGRLYAVNQGGDAFVLKVSPKFELLSTNPMGEKVIGSIAVSNGDLFIRGHKHLWCIGGPKRTASR